jgi:hypothetical protein
MSSSSESAKGARTACVVSRSGMEPSFECPPPNLFWRAGIHIELVKLVFDVIKCALGNDQIERVIETVQIRLFQDRPEGNRGAGPQRLRFAGPSQDFKQNTGKLVIHDYQIGGQPRRDQPIGFSSACWRAHQGLLNHLPGIARPIPWRCVLQEMETGSLVRWPVFGA